MELNDLLRRAVDAGASDIHLKLDRPPMLRRDGSVAPLEGAEPLTEADLDAYLRTVTAIAPQRYDLYHESGDLDIAYTAATCRASASTRSGNGARPASHYA